MARDMEDVSVWSWLHLALTLISLGCGIWTILNLRKWRRLREDTQKEVDARLAIAIAVLDQQWPHGDDRWATAAAEARRILRAGVFSAPAPQEVAGASNQEGRS
jgi:endo-1,4-beta-D-glucanase Y